MKKSRQASGMIQISPSANSDRHTVEPDIERGLSPRAIKLAIWTAIFGLVFFYRVPLAAWLWPHG